MFGLSIKREVWKAIKAKIKEAQSAYETELSNLKENHFIKIDAIDENAESEVDRIRDEAYHSIRAEKVNHEIDKSQLASKHITSVLSKII